VVAVRVVDPKEIKFPKAGYLMVEDAETGIAEAFNSSSAKKLQRLKIESGAKRVAQNQICAQAGVDLIDLYCGQDIVKPLIDFFRIRENP